MVRVTFIGTGSAFAVGRRTNIALLVQEDDTSLVLECGPTILQQLDRVGATAAQVDHLFISHRHGDHILGLPMFLLMRYMGGTSAGPLTILGSEDTLQAGQELTRIVYPEMLDRLGSVTWVDMPSDRPTRKELGSIELATFPMPHSPEVSVLALRLDFHKSGRSLVYTGDTTYHKDVVDFAAGCDLLVHETNFSQTLHPDLTASDYGHSTAHEAGLIAAQACCRFLALVHLSPTCDGHEDQVRAEAAQEFDGTIIIPTDGSTLYL